METLDGFIQNLFRTEKPVLSKQDFENDDVWVCDLLNQDIETANEFVKFRLASCSSRMEKLEFLYSSRSCFKYTIEELESELNPEYQSEEYYYRGKMPKDKMIERLNRYKKALTMTDQAICFYIDCSTIDCKDKKNQAFQLRKKQGAKTDLIRILNAVYELQMFEKTDGQIPSKEMFMKQAGEFFGTDLSKYDIDLSQALNNTTLETNIKVFEKMKEVTQNSHYISKKEK
jgi:hypothetical protein